MGKSKEYYIPLNLRDFTVENNLATTDEVKQELQHLVDWMKINQEKYLENGFSELAEEIISTSTPIRGSMNSLGRKLNIQPPNPSDYQPYNTAEMFRTSILTKTAGHIQSELLLNVINDFNVELDQLTPKDVMKEYKNSYPSHKAPTFQFVKRSIERLKNGVLHGTPGSSNVLPFWTTDTHYSKVRYTEKEVYFSLKLPNVKHITLKFNIPKNKRFADSNKISRPNVFKDKKGRIVFGFTIIKDVEPEKPVDSYLGIDLGIVESFVGTVISDKYYSAPLLADRKINTINDKIRKLKKLQSSIYAKEIVNLQRGHTHKYEVLRAERLLIRSKLSRLKVEKSHYVANQIVNIASVYNSMIVMEDLTWVPNSTWDQARTQETIESKAKQKGVKTRRVNPKNTSQNCTLCKSKVTHSQRSTKCMKCLKKLNRDVLASRNISNKAAQQDLKKLKQLSLQTRVTKPVTPGELINKVNKLYNLIE